MTIEERADEFSAKWLRQDQVQISYDGYMQGAIDQKKVDLDNMCKYIERFNNDMPMTMQMTMQIDVESFRKWAEQAMED